MNKILYFELMYITPLDQASAKTEGRPSFYRQVLRDL